MVAKTCKPQFFSNLDSTFFNPLATEEIKTLAKVKTMLEVYKDQAKMVYLHYFSNQEVEIRKAIEESTS